MVANSYKEQYISYLIKEMELKKALFSNIKTIYIGGGTPSSIPLPSLEYLFEQLFTYVNRANILEFTVEVNPIDVNKDLITLFKKYGVNRISLGVQSFDDEKLQFLGRTHNRKQAIQAVKICQKYGIRNINLDLIYATPNDSFKKIKKDLIQAIKLNITHLSTYSLILEEKTILYHQYQKKLYQPFDPDQEYQIYMKLTRFLKSYGFKHYEISNFAKNKYQSRHNMTYWLNQKYLGIGAGASYYIDNIRYTNVMNLKQYFAGIDNRYLNYQEEVELTIKDQMQEEVMLGLRMVKGINLDVFQAKYQKTIEEAFPFINDLIKKKWLKIKKHYLYIPEKMLYLSNSIISEFM